MQVILLLVFFYFDGVYIEQNFDLIIKKGITEIIKKIAISLQKLWIIYNMSFLELLLFE
jgi:hypothetical protein